MGKDGWGRRREKTTQTEQNNYEILVLIHLTLFSYLTSFFSFQKYRISLLAGLIICRVFLNGLSFSL